jgi:hypothetical protein
MMANRPLASILLLTVAGVVGLPGIVALCAGSPAARVHACCADGNDCATLAAPAHMRCCEAAPMQAPAGSRRAVLSDSGARSVAALPAAAQVLAHATASGGDARGASLASFPDSLSTLSSPLRL